MWCTVSVVRAASTPHRLITFIKSAQGDPRLVLHYGDLADNTNLIRIIQQVQPNEIYNLGAETRGIGLKPRVHRQFRCWHLRILEAADAGLTHKQGSIRQVANFMASAYAPEGMTFYHGPCGVALYPADPVNYRGPMACMPAINLVQSRITSRGETFVTRKITRGFARINEGLEDCLYMGNLDSLRDWGHARDYVEMQWRMLQQPGIPEDFVIATGRQESVRRFIELTALALGWGALRWEGEGINEIGRRSTGEIVVRIDPRYFRPAEVATLLGDPTKAQEKLGWAPTTTLEELVSEMVEADLEDSRKEAILRLKGFNVLGSMENPPTNASEIVPTPEKD